jgi:hypothetical protein
MNIRNAPALGLSALLACSLLIAGCLGDGTVAPDSTGDVPRSGPPQNLVVAAVGLDSQPARLDFRVPATTSADITAARLRWVGRGANPAGDPNIVVNSHQRAGTLLAVQDVGGECPWLFVYEYDASSLVRHGRNTLYVSGFDLGEPMRLDGLAVIVTYIDQSSPWTAIHFVDPREFVRDDAGSVWEFPVGYARDARNAHFVVVASDCEVGSTDRIWWSAESGPAPASLAGSAPNVFENRLGASAGPWMDVVSEDIAIPTNAAHFAYQLESPADGTGDSIVHLLGALCIDGEPTTCLASVSGRVWHDENRNGIEDDGEAGIAEVTAELQGGSGESWQASTDADGAFSFAGLCAGEYVLVLDESTLPPEWEPTTCDGGDCSPLSVNLPTDDAVVSSLAFGWALTAPPPEDVCFRGPGFWKHQYSCLVRGQRGHAQLDSGDLVGLLQTVESKTSIDWTRGDGSLDPEDAVFILEQTRGHCAQAHRHWLTALLNWAYNGAHPDLPVDTDRDGEVDSTMGVVITVVEPMLVLGQEDACREAKQLATAVNETPSVNCGLRNVGESNLP